MSTTHTFTRTWGDDYTFRPVDGTEGRQAMITGWKSGIRAGDYLILQNNAATTRYQVDWVEYERDPVDMFHALIWFAPRPA
jgi:hypothetical protein